MASALASDSPAKRECIGMLSCNTVSILNNKQVVFYFFHSNSYFRTKNRQACFM